VITVSDDGAIKTIIVKPNHSATWKTNLWVVLAISVPSLGAAIAFALLGAWPILPFAGAELLGLSAALYYVNWKLQYRHVVTLDRSTVKLDKGYYAPKKTWRFARAEVGLSVTPESHPWEGPKLGLHDRGEYVSVGEFLNREEALQCLKALREEFPIRTHSREQQRQL